jgi:P22 coat protein - gene protein 5
VANNTITGLMPTLYEALNVVSREMVGMIPAVSRDSQAERAALGQVVRSPIAAVNAPADVTPGNVSPATSGVTIGSVDVTITKSRQVSFGYNGEQSLGLGASRNAIMRDQFAEAMRALANEIERDLAIEGYRNASRAHGTAGTAPFGTAGNLSDFAGVMRILEDNGAPKGDLQLALGSAAIANLRGLQSVLFRVNEAGSSDMLRDGMTDRVQGFALRNSAGVLPHVAGTGSGFLVNQAGGEAIGETVITADTGTGTILAGDIVTFAGDANAYAVNTALSGGAFAIGAPGMRILAADNAAITVGASYTPNLAFDRRAIVLAARAPALPDGGDDADDRTLVTDPVTGLTFEVSVYRQYRQVRYEVALAWGVKAVKPAHIAILRG